MSSTIERARSFLFVPASRPERFVKAMQTAADCIILDLEDAVSMNDKDVARGNVTHYLPQCSDADRARILVRINASDTAWHQDDLKALAGAPGAAGVVIPKSETVAVLDAAAAILGNKVKLVPLIESLAGLDAATELAGAAQVNRLAFGHLDFQLDLGMKVSPEESELSSVRFALVAASRRAKLAAPIDGVTVDTGSESSLRRDTERSRAFGFGAKLCIHPQQVNVVNELLSPSEKELDWASRVMQGNDEHQGRVFSLDGKMVDLPVIRLAQQLLAKVGS